MEIASNIRLEVMSKRFTKPLVDTIKVGNNSEFVSSDAVVILKILSNLSPHEFA